MQKDVNKINLNLFSFKIFIVLTFAFIINLHQSFGSNFTCTLITSNVDFGIINPYDSTFEQTTSNIKVQCTNNGSLNIVSYTLTFSTGASNNALARISKSGTNSLAYNIHKDSAFTQILGSGIGSTFTITNSFSLSIRGTKTDTYVIYGKIPVQPLARVGTYTDTITATLTYNSL